MSKEYEEYLTEHKANVRKGFEWIRDNLPELIIGNRDYEWQICFNHDASKTKIDEYDAYCEYFYGYQEEKPQKVIDEFNKAWLLHIHRNPHHYQHWVLINDNPEEGTIALDMPYHYILEMICDWWSFSWKTGNLREIFSWYEERKDYIQFSEYTRTTVEDILGKIKAKLDEEVVEPEETEDMREVQLDGQLEEAMDE